MVRFSLFVVVAGRVLALVASGSREAASVLRSNQMFLLLS